MLPVILMNPNTSRATTAAMVAIAAQEIAAVTGWTAPEGPPMITDGASLDHAAELVAAACLPAARGILVSAFGDPGQGALSRRLSCPVIGIGAAAAAAAAEGGRSFAVATTTPGLAGRIDQLMRLHGAAGHYVGCFLSRDDPEALMKHPDMLDRALLDAITRATAAGAEAVIIGGGPLGEAAERLRGKSGVALIAPIRAAARAMRQLLAEGD